VKKNPRGDPYMDARLKKYVGILLPGIPAERVESEINEQYFTYGSPYIVVCRICNEGIYPCLLVRRTPNGTGGFIDEPLGVLVFVNNDHRLDAKVEFLMKLARVIRSYGLKTGFYLPLSSLKATIHKLCASGENPRFEVYSLKMEEASVFLEEEE
jgi:hypothetical protein